VKVEEEVVWKRHMKGDEEVLSAASHQILIERTKRNDAQTSATSMQSDAYFLGLEYAHPAALLTAKKL
jgi:hypothetical protein